MICTHRKEPITLAFERLVKAKDTLVHARQYLEKISLAILGLDGRASGGDLSEIIREVLEQEDEIQKAHIFYVTDRSLDFPCLKCLELWRRMDTTTPKRSKKK